MNPSKSKEPQVMLSRLVSRLAAWTGLALMLASPVAALEIRRHQGSGGAVDAIDLIGRIEEGDVLALQAYIGKLPGNSAITVYLDSVGGRMQEAMALGRFFHRTGIRTIIPAGAKCISACGLAFLGGHDQVSGKPYRVKSSTGRLGYHSFRTDYKPRDYTAKNMAEAVAHAQKVILDVTDYLKDVGESLEFLRLALKSDSRNMTVLSNDEALDHGIYVLDERTGQLVDPLATPRQVKS
jgi:hypothetical protein